MPCVAISSLAFVGILGAGAHHKRTALMRLWCAGTPIVTGVIKRAANTHRKEPTMKRMNSNESKTLDPFAMNTTCTRRGLFGALAAAAFGCLVAPGVAMADDAGANGYGADVMAYSVAYDGTTTPYYTTDDAISAGYQGKVIYLNVDWMFTGTMTVADGKLLTIDMNGHKITSQGGGTVIRLYENADLTLRSTAQSARTFRFEGFDANTGDPYDMDVVTGGLITGGKGDEGGAFRMDNHSTLTLDNVVVAGNRGGKGGAIYAKKGCTINMKKGASIQHNVGETGGIYVNQEDTTIWMDNSNISYNRATKSGGAIYSDADGTRIHLFNKSVIYRNSAQVAGGGIFFNKSWFNVISEDNTGSIEGNMTTSDGEKRSCGGGIATDTKSFSSSGEIRGINLSENHADYHGGAIYLHHSNIKVVDCFINDNNAVMNGGGIYIDASDCSVEDCTITNNLCREEGVGGGLTALYKYDIKLSGVCVIKNNMRGNPGTVDDVFLQTRSGYTNCIDGKVEGASHIGVRTDLEGDKRIAKNIGSFITGTFFMDTDGYEVTTSTDEGGSVYQHKA